MGVKGEEGRRLLTVAEFPTTFQGKNLCPDLLPRLSLVMRSPTAAAGMMLHHASLTLTLHFGVFRTHRDEALMVQVGRL